MPQLLFALLIFLSLTACQTPRVTLLDARAESRTSIPAMGYYGIGGYVLHFKNESGQTIRSICVSTQVQIPESYHGPGSIAPPGWKPPLHTYVHNNYANLDLAPGAECFFAGDEHWPIESPRILDIQASAKPFHPPALTQYQASLTGYLFVASDQSWRPASLLPNNAPTTLHNFITRNDPPDSFHVPADRAYTWQPISLVIP